MESLMLSVGSRQVQLFGDGIEVPVKGCRRTTGKVIEDGSQLRVEEIEVVLHGLPAEIDEWLRKIEALFSRINLGEQAVLYIQPVKGMDIYQSRVESGKLELLRNGTSDLKRGGMGVKLELLRDNFWEGPEVSIPLSNLHGSDVVNGLVLDNHYSPGIQKCNYALIDGEDIDGEVPAPATVKIKNQYTIYPASIQKFLIGQSTIAELQPGDHWIEGSLGESTLMFGSVMEPASTSGTYYLVQWSGGNSLTVFKYQMENVKAARFAGKLVKPVIRLQDSVSTDDYWIRVKISQGDAIERTRWQKVEKSVRMIVLPTVHMPPRNLDSDMIEDIWFALEMQRKTAGTHTFTIDDIDLIPVDGFREYKQLGGYGITYGKTLIDNLSEGLLYSQDFGTSYRLLTHVGSGKGIWVVPGLNQMLVVKFDNNMGRCNPDHTVEMSMSYKPRRINL
jgi:hypothetical protein